MASGACSLPVVVFLALGTRGDVQPLFILARKLLREHMGVRVVVATHGCHDVCFVLKFFLSVNAMPKT